LAISYSSARVLGLLPPVRFRAATAAPCLPSAVRVRADAALVRALTATDAELVLLGPDEADIDGGIAGLLRYADAATRHR
jgi:hypothetical protein